MALKKLGAQTLFFPNRPLLLNWAAVTGPREGAGPLGASFDMVSDDSLLGQESWEKAEQRLMQYSLELVLSKMGWRPRDLDFLFAGDLLNQIVSSNFTARELGTPYFGLYGACSTLAEGLALAGVLIDGGYAERVAAAAVSHHNSAEKELRFPTELGAQRTMTAQWTVTGGGAYLLAAGEAAGWRLTLATIGKVQDLGVQDSTDMGSAMAPAAFGTIMSHFADTGRSMRDYDCVVTGDLGVLGSKVLLDLLKKADCNTEAVTDCGLFVYGESQDAHNGASGCGCSAVVLGPLFLAGRWPKPLNRLLFVGTGALLSPITAFQGESIPAIAHAVCLERGEQRA
jgi:stage V sporulation protein AD